MSLASIAWVALGGALGSVARVLVGWAVPASSFPWATLTVNVAGSGLIGWLISTGVASGASVDSRWYTFGVVGVCGGFTTFSAFSWQTFEKMQRGEWGAVAANVILSVVLCLAATWLGWRLAK